MCMFLNDVVVISNHERVVFVSSDMGGITDTHTHWHTDTARQLFFARQVRLSNESAFTCYLAGCLAFWQANKCIFSELFGKHCISVATWVCLMMIVELHCASWCLASAFAVGVLPCRNSQFFSLLSQQKLSVMDLSNLQKNIHDFENMSEMSLWSLLSAQLCFND